MEALETVESSCPYCGGIIELSIERTIDSSRYTEDCSICCRPIVVIVNCSPEGALSVETCREED